MLVVNLAQPVLAWRINFRNLVIPPTVCGLRWVSLIRR